MPKKPSYLIKIINYCCYPLLPKDRLASSLTYRKIRYALVFLAPMLMAISVVALYPIALTLVTSFTDAELISMLGDHWVGFDNYWDVLTDEHWWRCVSNTLIFATSATLLQITMGTVIALMVDQRFRGERTTKIALMLPWSILVVVSIQIWLNMFSSARGIVNEVLRNLGWLEGNFNWFQSQTSSFFVIVLTDTWRSLPFVTVLILSALQTIPNEHWEAARINGIGRFKTIVQVILPQIKLMLGVVTAFRWLDGMRVFELIFLMTTNSSSTASIAIYARERLLEFSEAGPGSAAAILIALFLVASIGLVGLMIQWTQRKGRT